MSNPNAMMMYDANKKQALIAYILWFFLGMLGGHRFYLGRISTALLMLVGTLVSSLLTFVLIGFLGLFFISLWWFVDALLIPGMVERYNRDLAARLS